MKVKRAAESSLGRRILTRYTQSSLTVLVLDGSLQRSLAMFSTLSRAVGGDLAGSSFTRIRKGSRGSSTSTTNSIGQA